MSNHSSNDKKKPLHPWRWRVDPKPKLKPGELPPVKIPAYTKMGVK